MNYSILSPMRSGSTFLFRMLRDFSKDYNSKLNDEFFNTVYPGWSVEDTGQELINTNREYFLLNEEVDYRIDLLKKYNCEYTIKILSTHLTDNIIEFVSTNYQPIVLDRRNKYEQYLSYIIAFYTDVWNSGNTVQRIISPFESPRTYALNFFKIEEEWLKDKKVILENLSPIELFYEDLATDPINYLRYNGIKTRPFSSHYRGLYKLNIKNSKKDCIINLTEINNIYKENKHIWNNQ